MTRFWTSKIHITWVHVSILDVQILDIYHFPFNNFKCCLDKDKETHCVRRKKTCCCLIPLTRPSRSKLSMDMRVLLFLFIVSTCWCCNARELSIANHFNRKDESFPVLQTNKLSEGESQLEEEVSKNNELCTLCEDFASEALNYLSENKTKTEIISVLHKSCSKIPTFKQQCIVLVDYYVPLFFSEVSNIQPEFFCQKVDLCEQAVSIAQQLSKNTCDICHHAVTEALLKLKDPDTQLDIIELLLKACNSVEGYAKKCKRLVFEYGPLILVNAEQFLEKNDVCIALHACASTAIGAEQEALARTEHSAS